MFDVTSRITYRSVPTWYRDITRVCPSIPVVLCANKVDAQDRKVKASQITFHTKHKFNLVEMSVKENYNTDLPFLDLARQLSGYSNLQLVDTIALCPPALDADVSSRLAQSTPREEQGSNDTSPQDDLLSLSDDDEL